MIIINKNNNYIKAFHFEEGLINPFEFEVTKNVNIDGVRKGYYTVNNFGEVYNKKGNLVQQRPINSGYYKYSLVTEPGSSRKYKEVLAAHVVLHAFDPRNDESNLTANHKNYVKSDNSLKNLEWVTQKENNDHKNKLLLNYGSNNYQAKFTQPQIRTIYRELQKGTSYTDILRILNLSVNRNNRDSIGNIKLGKTYKEEINKIRKEKFND